MIVFNIFITAMKIPRKRKNNKKKKSTRHKCIDFDIDSADSIESLDLYMQQLADITLQEDPYAIIWPVFNEVVE